MGSIPVSPPEIEGPFKTFNIHIVGLGDKQRVVNFFRDHFLEDEPTMRLLCRSPDLEEDMGAIVDKMLDEKLSLMAVGDGNDEIAGVWISYHDTDIEVARSPKARKYLKMVEDAEKLVDFGKDFGTTDFCTMFAVCVAPSCRRQGLGSELCKRSLALFLDRGIQHAVVKCTSPFTRSMMIRLGFEPLATLSYDKLKDEAGDRMFEDSVLDSSVHYVSIYGKMVVKPFHVSV